MTYARVLLLEGGHPVDELEVVVDDGVLLKRPGGQALSEVLKKRHPRSVSQPQDNFATNVDLRKGHAPWGERWRRGSYALRPRYNRHVNHPGEASMNANAYYCIGGTAKASASISTRQRRRQQNKVFQPLHSLEHRVLKFLSLLFPTQQIQIPFLLKYIQR